MGHQPTLGFHTIQIVAFLCSDKTNGPKNPFNQFISIEGSGDNPAFNGNKDHNLFQGSWVISPGWLKESFREGRFVDEMPFIVKDVEYELKYRTELKDTVVRARASPGALLKGFEVCLAAHVQPPISTLSAIVRSAGGNVIRNLEKVKDSSKTIFVASEESMDEALSAVKKGIP